LSHQAINNNNFIIGVDMGTSGTKAIALTTAGEVIGNAYMPYSPLAVETGYHELDPAILFNAVTTTLYNVLEQTRSVQDGLSGISFSTAMHSLMVVDAKGHPLTNLITWADRRSADVAQNLKGTPLGQDIYRHTGTPIHPMSPLCKIRWIKDQEPALFNNAHKFIGIKEFIFHRFFDQYLVDHSIASCTGLFDSYRKQWYAPALAFAGITAHQLSQPVPATYMVKGLQATYAQQFGIDPLTPFIIGASDGCLANLGSNATQPGDMAITVGTSGAVRMITAQPAYDAQERIFNYVLTDELYVSGGALNNGLVLLKWYAASFLQQSITKAHELAAFVEQAAKAPAGADGLICLPYWQGERAPVWDADAKGVFLGVHTGHTPAHFMRAIIEGINYALLQVSESVQQTVGNVLRVYASGGFINAPLWLQWLADALGKEIRICQKEDASALGAAVLGGWATGMIRPGELPPSFHTTQQYYPNAQQHAIYQQYYKVYTALYDQLKPAFNTLSNIHKPFL
jgi:gluconokinase